VAQAVADAASPAVRNVGTAAGNLMQRPRCWYYRNDEFDCFKKGGDRCYAQEGENQYHAIFDIGPCVIVHPSNLAPALLVCDATLHVIGGDRDTIPLADFFHTPFEGIMSENILKNGEVITHITFQPRPKSGFYAIKEKQSFDWPTVLAAAALEMNGETIRSARICAGAVSPVPKPLPEVERALKGVQVTNDKALRQACARAGRGANPLAQNEYKVAQLPVAVRRAVMRAAGRDEEMSA
jgi:xanthine dehydrogenase YagS FAD-binding subunit